MTALFPPISPSARTERTPAVLYLAAIMPAALILLAVVLQPFVPAGELMRDPMVLANEAGTGRAWFGMISNLGVMAWSAAVACALLGAALSRRTPGATDATMWFHLIGGGIGLLLALDDMFMIHEDHRLDPFGGETAVMAAYGMMTMAWLTLFRRQILRGPAGLLGLSLTFFGLSLILDLALPKLTPDSPLWVAEDGAKFMGICCWLVFHFQAAMQAGCPRPPTPRPWHPDRP